MLKFKLATPERVVLDTEVDSLTLPTQMGEITILPHHIPLVSNLQPGEIRYKKGGHEEFLAVSGGFVEVQKNNQVTILADSAEFGHEIDLDRAQLARQKAERYLTEVRHDQKNMASAAAALQKQLVRINVAHKHRTRKGTHIEQSE